MVQQEWNQTGIEETESANFRRFLLTGSESGIYAAGAQAAQPGAGSLHFIAKRGHEAVEEILNFAYSRDQAALFALALAASPRFADKETNARALAALPLSARSAADLANFAGYAESLRGWGRGLRTAVANWYLAQPVRGLAAQILRAPAANLKRHRAVLKRAHPKAGSLSQNALFQWIADGSLGHLATPEVRGTELAAVEGLERARVAQSLPEVVRCIEEYKLGPAQLPRRWKASAAIWEAMFDHLSYRQLLRYLPAMSAAGFLTRQSAYAAVTVARLADRGRLRAGSVHPIRIAEAMKRYRRTEARPVEAVFDALHEAFHLSVDCAVQPVGKRVLIAVDGSASMQGVPVHGLPLVPAALAAATLALSLAAACAKPHVVAFHREVVPLDFGKRTRLPDALNQIRATPSRSDAAAPIRYAMHEGLQIDAFVIATDRAQGDCLAALREYRKATGIHAKLALVNLASSKVDGWDADPGCIAFAGLDHGAPAALHGFL